MASLLLAVIYLAFISLGLPDSTLGAAWPTIYAEMNIPISYMGIVSFVISAGTILSVLLTDRAIAKLGTKWVVFISVMLTAVAMFGFSSATEFYHICLWGVPYGLGAGAIDAALNNYVALHYNSRHMSWLHCFWGVGTIISPYIMSYTLTQGSWNGGYRALSFIQLTIAAVILFSFPLWKKNSSTGEEIKTEPTPLSKAVKIKGVMPVLIGFMSYCAAECTAMLWASSYFEGMFSVSKEEAASLGSLFFIGITAGRFLAGFITERFGDSKMIFIGSIVAAAGILLTAIPVKEVAIVGFIVLGFGCAPIYPCIIHSTPIRFGEERSQSIIGIQMAAAYLGSTVMPSLFGLVANHISISLMPLYLGIFTLLMIVMIKRADRETLTVK
jgi:fucose permease